MKREFDPGYDSQPFRLLCESYPGEEVYPRHDFRIEWGPVFHRGRLDGSATVLLIGQDPAANEAIVRRILVGVAGKRTQGLLRKLGLTRSYVMVNAFLYSVYGQQGGEKHRNDPKIAAYRHQWLDALLVGKNVQAVLSLGSLADSAWRQYLATPSGAMLNVAYAKLLHPTYPDSAAGGDPTLLTQKTAELLANWNTGLAKVRAAVTRQDVAPDPEPYGDAFEADEIVDIPAFDIPAGLPEWMRREDGWSKRTGATTADKRATLTVTVPAADMTSADAVTASVVERRAAEGAAEPADALALAAEPVDPLPKGRLALAGRVITMVRGERPIEAGVVYIQDGLIVAVRQAGEAAPAGFTAADVLDTGATLYPGLIELHNHLAYNILPMWKVPRRFGNRNEWSRRDPDYAAAVKGPMAILGTLPEVLPAIGRYVECKALMGGATTSQGIGLQSASGGQTKFFRGMIRNVEQTGEPKDLPEARTRIPDFSRGDIPDFLAQLTDPKTTCFLYHLSEGTDGPARQRFLDLQLPNGQWAITPTFAGIHAVGLEVDDLRILQTHGGAMVWSPLSNLVLYGATAKITAATDAGVRIALGADWSPSGSKNILGELKAARVAAGGAIRDEELLAMATSVPAQILGWDRGARDDLAGQASRPDRGGRHRQGERVRRPDRSQGAGHRARGDQRRPALRHHAQHGGGGRIRRAGQGRRCGAVARPLDGSGQPAGAGDARGGDADADEGVARPARAGEADRDGAGHPRGGQGGGRPDGRAGPLGAG